MILSSASVLEVGTPGDLEEALTGGVDLAVVDLEGARADGLAVVSRAKERSAGAPPIVVLTADDLHRTVAARLGADGVLASPPGFSDLQAAVISALGKPARVGRVPAGC